MIAALLLLGWMCLIFSLSAESAEESSKTSRGTILWLVKTFSSDFEELSPEMQEAQVESLQFFVRKAAHFSLYGGLGFFAFFAVITYTRLWYRVRMLIGASFCLLYAIGDEIHQLFVSGRSGEVRDVLIDFCGAISGILITAAIARLIKPIYRTVRYHEK